MIISAVPVIAVSDSEKSEDYYCRVLGFHQKENLQLAGQGDIKQQFDQVEEVGLRNLQLDDTQISDAGLASIFDRCRMALPGRPT